MILTEKHFEHIKANIVYEYDVFTEIFAVKALTPFFEFRAYYNEKDVVKNQYVISPLKMDIHFYSEIILGEIELSGVQKKEVACWLKDLYEGEYLEAKQEYLKESDDENALFDRKYTEAMDLVTSDWYN